VPIARHRGSARRGPESFADTYGRIEQALGITVDAEEDNWFGFQEGKGTTRNAERLVKLQGLFDEFRVVVQDRALGLQTF
jgi:hypothetical protein